MIGSSNIFTTHIWWFDLETFGILENWALTRGGHILCREVLLLSDY